eukprot:COSAG06_NODE_250_length_19080_cov_6.483029_3_plen_63_part_00
MAPGAQRHQFNMASEAEGDALCAALNANCRAIATVQKEADKQGDAEVVRCVLILSVTLDPFG